MKAWGKYSGVENLQPKNLFLGYRGERRAKEPGKVEEKIKLEREGGEAKINRLVEMWRK